MNTCEYRYIQTTAALKQILSKISSTPKRIGIDCETTGLDPHTARLRTIQIALPNRPVLVIDCFQISDLSPLSPLLCGNSLKIGHNLKFDWQFLHHAGLTLSAPLFDTMLAFQVLTAGIKVKANLANVCQKMLHLHLDKSSQKSNFNTKHLTANQLHYAALDAEAVLQLYPVLKERLKSANLYHTAQVEFNCLPYTAQLELNGIRLDSEQWEQLAKQLKTRQNQLLLKLSQLLNLPTPPQQLSLFDNFSNNDNPIESINWNDKQQNNFPSNCHNLINWNSPQQVIQALNQVGINVKSTNIKTLIPLARKYPVIPILLEYRSLSNLINNFIQPIPKHIHPITHRIHSNWFQIGAKSGRFSCRHPNLTNIPRQSQFRSCFIPTPDNVFIKADYSQIELRIMAKISNDSRMIAAYQSGLDLHSITASLLFNCSIEKVTKEQRQLGKIVNFGFIYGMGVDKFRLQTAQKYGIYLDQKEASNFRKIFFQTYTGIAQFHQTTRQTWQKDCRVSYTLDGRRRIWSKSHPPTLNEMLNHPIQGTNATIIKRAIALIGSHLETRQAHLIVVVHDEIVLECPDNQAETLQHLLINCMKNAATPLLNPIPVEIDSKISPCWN